MENGIVKPMLRSLLISYVLSGLLLGALAFALYKLRLKEGQVNLMVYLVYLGRLSGRRSSSRKTSAPEKVLLGTAVRTFLLSHPLRGLLGHEPLVRP